MHVTTEWALEVLTNHCASITLRITILSPCTQAMLTQAKTSV